MSEEKTDKPQDLQAGLRRPSSCLAETSKTDNDFINRAADATCAGILPLSGQLWTETGQQSLAKRLRPTFYDEVRARVFRLLKGISPFRSKCVHLWI